MDCCSGIWMFLLPAIIIWWLVASVLVMFTWNHVVTAVTTAKTMHYRHAMLLVFTLGILCGPHHAQNWRNNNSCPMKNKLVMPTEHPAMPMPELKPAE